MTCEEGESKGSKPSHIPQRILVFGWGLACEAVLRELKPIAEKHGTKVHCISHISQASDCDLREVCNKIGCSCDLTDSDEDVLAIAASLGPELILSASYRRRIPNSVLNLCRDSLNFHPSLLPKHRGCWSGFWAIFDGDTESGVTCHRMMEKFDVGPIICQERFKIAADETSFSLYKKALPVTAAVARAALTLIFGTGLPAGQPQQGEASYHRRCLPFGGVVQPEWSNDQVERFIRAMVFPPFKGAVMDVDGKQVEVLSLAHYRELVAKPQASQGSPIKKPKLCEVTAGG
mmetsp:Transcript_22244/g.50776  ORF Transcript_22244/g.50776 Transcript_22244/m.50776 type:complete len:290 (-) Transcript_22244:46-915(-)